MQYLILFLSLINLLLGIIIMIHSKYEKENITFLGFAFFSSLWTFNNFYLRINTDVTVLRVSYGLGIIVATAGLVWVYFFLKKKLPTFVKIVVFPLSILLFFVAIDSNLIINSLYSITFFGYTGDLGNLFYLYSSYFAFVIFSIIYVLSKQYLAEKNTAVRDQIKYVLAGAVLFITVSSIVSFVIPVFFHTLEYTIFDNFSFSLFLICIGYAILKYKLFNVKVIVTEIFVFFLWSLILIRTIISQQTTDLLINGGLLIVTVVVGIFLIRSVAREVAQREKIEKLAVDLERSNTELEVANERLKELDRQKTEFVSIASHQLRSPLTAIKGYSSMLLEGSFGKLADKPREAVQIVFESSQKLVGVIEDFLNITRIELGKMKYEMSIIDMGKMVESVVNELKPNVMRRGLTMTFTGDEGPYNILADSGKLNQVFLNVIDNAIKYTPKGSIAVKIERREEGGKNIIRFSSTDTGVGMDQTTIPKLFEKFVRASGAGQINISGTGLGLYVAKQIVEAHGGKIWAESDGKGHGSTFIMEMAETKPLAEQKKEAEVKTFAGEL